MKTFMEELEHFRSIQADGSAMTPMLQWAIESLRSAGDKDAEIKALKDEIVGLRAAKGAKASKKQGK